MNPEGAQLTQSRNRVRRWREELYLWLRPTRRFIPLPSAADGTVQRGPRSFSASAVANPQLDLRFEEGRLPQGLCRVRYAATAGSPPLRPRLLVDAGAGFVPVHLITHASADGADGSAIFKLPPNSRAVRLEPLDHPGDFEIGDLTIEELGRLRAGFDLLWPVVRRALRSPHRMPERFAQLWARRRGGLPALKSLLLNQQPTEDYEAWRDRYSVPSASDRRLMAVRVAHMQHPPRISIVMPTYETPEKWLRPAIESVRGQIYPHWELCIADDASPNRSTAQLLERYARADPRIKVTFRSVNGHISAASNSALELATGDFVAFLDHDDELAPDALFWVAEKILEHPEAELVYTDEDKIDGDGRHCEPHFKCAWNYDLLLSYNMITHLGVYRADRVRALGGLREGYEGAQDHDLALRFTAGLNPASIRHVPRVLYHWRRHDDSTAAGHGAKSYAFPAGARAIADHLSVRGIAADVLPAAETPFAHRVRYHLPARRPSVTLVIPTRNGLHLLKSCLDSILNRTDYPDYDVLVIDNGSDDPEMLRYLAELPLRGPVEVVRDDGPFNFSAINNRAVALAPGRVIGLLNNDLEVIEADWLREMVSHAVRPEIGAVGARLWYGDQTLQHGGVVLGVGGAAGHAHKHLPRGNPGYMGRAAVISGFSAVTGACLIVRKQVYEEVGGLDEKLAIAFNDIDFCLRVRERGYRNLWTPYAELYHHESKTRGYETTAEKRMRFEAEAAYMLARWGESLQDDPAYNPNLTLSREDFGLAWPPRVATLAKHLELVGRTEATCD